jgi:hypothetical protein
MPRLSASQPKTINLTPPCLALLLANNVFPSRSHLTTTRLDPLAVMDLFRVRLNCVDNYQSTPTKFDPVLRNNVKPSQIQKEPKVPVIRVFGATETGQKVCAHIHGAFPYLYIEYTGSLVPDDGMLPCLI